MKEGHMIWILFIVFMILVARLILNEETQEPPLVEPQSFESQGELAVFVTLENKIALHKLQSEKDGTMHEKPEYSRKYPNLYAVPKTEWEIIQEGEKICYLTFDDGPSKNTLKVLDILDKYEIKAVFFVIGEEIMLNEENQTILKEVSDRGHMIALHTYCHDYRKIYASVDSFLQDYEKVFNTIEEVTGQRPYIYRFPGGSYNSSVKWIRRDIIAEMERRGFVYYDWNVSAEDSVGNPSSYSIIKNVKRDLIRYQLPVVLMHDGMPNKITAQTLEKVIQMIQENGYGFGRLDERFPCQFKW